MSIWPDWLKAIQLKARYLFGIWLFGLLILVMPKGWADALRITPIRGTAGGFIGIATIGAFVFGLVALIPSIQKRRKARRQREAILGSLDALSNQEFMLWVIAYCSKKTVLLPMTSTEANVAAGLCQKRLMVRALGSHNITAWPHTIPAFVWDELQLRIAEFLAKGEHDKAGMESYFSRLDMLTSGDFELAHRLW